jgi:hypothetical protein
VGTAVNGRRPNFFEILARLPPRVWLQGALALILFAILAVLGFAVIAGGVAIAVVILVIYRLRAWLMGVFSGRRREAGPPAHPGHHHQAGDQKVTDVTYEIVDRRDDKRP